MPTVQTNTHDIHLLLKKNTATCTHKHAHSHKHTADALRMATRDPEGISKLLCGRSRVLPPLPTLPLLPTADPIASPVGAKFIGLDLLASISVMSKSVRI